ncbi:MAG: hypothetical protein ABSG43_21430, partial [Solirubrobacteraceae bacterium]
MNHHVARLLAAERIADLKRAALSQHYSVGPWLVRRRFPKTSRAIRQDPAGRCAHVPDRRDALPTKLASLSQTWRP